MLDIGHDRIVEILLRKDKDSNSPCERVNESL